MLNKDNVRELAYLVNIDNIEPIVGSDNCEAAIVGGWRIMVRKETFKPGDLAIYFEIDSKVDTSRPAFEFLAKKDGKIKTQKYTFGGKGLMISQGLLMAPSDFNFNLIYDDKIRQIGFYEGDHNHYVDDESRFLTQLLNVTYADSSDNTRKANSVDKYKQMAQRHQEVFRKSWARWMMRREWGRKVMFFFFGKKKDKKNGWPSHICAKTDVERIQNMAWVLNDKRPYIASEKVDGCSSTVAVEKTKFGKLKYYVCSRNVVFEDESSKCFYDDNVYFDMYNKYNLKNIITEMLNDLKLNNIAIQFETYGNKIQRRDYSIDHCEMAVFHIVTNGVKFPMDKTIELCEKYGLPHVPIIDYNYILPDTLDELKQFVEGAPSAIDGKEKEGIVFYDKETGQQYFKFVSPEFLLKYHC